jgi:thiamine transporter ThiT
VVLIFLLCRRYWGMPVAIAAGAFAALSPVAVFNDDSGLVEPIAVAIVLLGIWWTPKHGVFAGIAWGVAAMARVEAWLFGAGLVVAWLLGRRTPQPRLGVVVGYLLTMGLYFKFLLDQTGNPIYPLYVNFQFVGLGASGTGATISQDQQILWIPLGLAVIGCVAGLVWSLWKQPASYLLLTYGFGYSALSFATYLRYATEWKERRFELPIDFAAILLAVLLLKVLPQRFVRTRAPGWALAAAGLVAVQLVWLPIQSSYTTTDPLFQYEVQLGHSISAVYNRPEYRGGVINMPGDEPTLLYVMARDGGVPGDRITSQFYDPFYYLPAGYRYIDHREVAGPLLLCWLWKTRTRLMLLSPPGPLSQSVVDYQAFIADHPEWFTQVGSSLGNGWLIYAVQLPPPASSACQSNGVALRASN